MSEIVAVDIGGTHARFAIAEVEHGRVVSLGAETVLKSVEHASLETAWAAFAAMSHRTLPPCAAIAVACPPDGAILKLTNNPWIIQPALLPARLGLDRMLLLNDFTAVGHAVAQVSAEAFVPLCGPDLPLPLKGVISIVGPGTGLGVSLLLREADGYSVVCTEGGHSDFAPLDEFEDRLLSRLRRRFRRASVERVTAGPGLLDIHALLSEIEDKPTPAMTDKDLWQLALSGSDPLAVAALDRFCLILGAVAGDIALTQGAHAVVIGGGLGLRLAAHLPTSGFQQRFCAKGRFEAMMQGIPVKLLTHPQPGLYGAAAAFAERYD